MVYYLFAMAFPLICWGINNSYGRIQGIKTQQPRGKKIFLVIVAVLPMFLLFVLRDKTIGSDTKVYVDFFENVISKYSIKEILQGKSLQSEIGFALYVKLISLISDSYTIFFFINGIIIFGALVIFSLKYTQNPFLVFSLCVLLGPYQFMLTGLRQTLAISICLMSVDFIKNRKLIPFLLFVVLAYFFHKSAVIFIFVYPLSSIKRYDWMFFWYAIITIILIFGFAGFQQIFNNLLGYDYGIEETGNGEIFFLLLFVMFMFSFIMLFDKNEKGVSLVAHLAIIAVIFWGIRLVSRTAERISFYFILGLYAYFANAIQYRKGNLMSFIKCMLIFACFGLFVYRNFNSIYLFCWSI